MSEKDTETSLEPGKPYGWTVAAGKQLRERLDVMKDLIALVHAPLEGKTPKARIHGLVEKVNKVDAVVRTGSMAWQRAGTEPRYRRAVSGYEGLYAETLRDCRLVLDGLTGKDPIEQGDMASHIERVTLICYFQHALFLTDVSFFDQDVTPTTDKTWVFPPSPYGVKGTKTQDTDLAGMKMMAQTIQELREKIERMERKR